MVKKSKRKQSSKRTDKKTERKIPSMKYQRKERWEDRIVKGSKPGDIQILKIFKINDKTIYVDHQVFHNPGKNRKKNILTHHGIKITDGIDFEKEGLEFSEKGLFDKRTNKKIGKVSRLKRWYSWLKSKFV